jgi:Rad3-related DNA helicase
MNASNKESSTYRHPTFRLSTFQRWLGILQRYSKKYEKYGSFLPPQEELLKQIYNAISISNLKVATFAAPPASGKTHAIALCASYFHDRSVSTCIVVPNNELKYEFQSEMEEINRKLSNPLPIVTIGTYIKRKNEFEFAFVDEAHNLRSAIELDRTIVKTFHLEAGDPLYADILPSLERDAIFTAKEMSMESAHDILCKLKGSEYDKDAGLLLRTLSQWRCFYIVSDATLELKFLAADPERRKIMPRGILFLFSATLLDQEELQFYCNIPREVVHTTSESQEDFVPKKNVTYYYASCESDSDKKRLVKSILKDAKLPTLILVNSNTACLQWSADLSDKLDGRVVTIKSGLDYTERLKIYKKFVNLPDQILLTSSSVYWEGITIKNLKFLIIPNPPFPQPTLLEIAQGRQTQYDRIARRRLIQGMGRIGRSPSEKGSCLLLFRPRGLAHFVQNITKEKAKHLMVNLIKSE